MTDVNSSDMFNDELELSSLVNDLEEAIEELRALGEDRAEKKREWFIARSKATGTYHAQNMHVTVIKDLVSGDPDVVDLEFEYDLADSLYWAQKALIQTLRTKISIKRDQIKIDWGV